jgi:signal transduction histidine kinase
MKLLSGVRGRLRRVSLQRRLPAAFAGVALLAMVALGAILLPLVSNHYSRSERSYLQAAAQQAARSLSPIDWQAVVLAKTTMDGTSGGFAATELENALRRAQVIALSTQVRVRVYDTAGELLVDSGLPQQIDVVGLTADSRSREEITGRGVSGRTGRGIQGHGLPSPVGNGLFGGQDAEDGSLSVRTISTPLDSGGNVVATVLLSDGPAYGSAVVRTTLVAWLIAGCAAVILAGLAGWFYSRRLTRPLVAMAVASNGMARGDLTVRAPVDRADEIGVLAESFNAMAEKNQATVTALRRFVADAAHEIGTPLTALRADLEMAKDSPDRETRERLIDRAIIQAGRIERLSGALLRLSLLETGLPSQLQPLDLVPLLRAVAGSFASRAEQAGIDFSLALPEHEVRVNGYQAGLRTAMDNLVDNALKFTPAGGSVEIGAEANDRRAVIWVKDSGIGVPQEDLGALFSRFHRGRNAAAYPGSGLGLAIVQTTMELHGGKASVSTSSQGSRFELQLPLV